MRDDSDSSSEEGYPHHSDSNGVMESGDHALLWFAGWYESHSSTGVSVSIQSAHENGQSCKDGN